MINPTKPDNLAPRDLVPVAKDTVRPALLEPVVGDYYYGQMPTKSAIARSYWQLICRQQWTLLATFLLVMAIGTAWTLTRRPVYRATMELLVTPIGTNSPNGGSLADEIGIMTRARSIATEIKLLRSQDLLDEAFAAVPEELRWNGFGTRQARLGKYPLEIENPKDSDVITFVALSHDPDGGAQLLGEIYRAEERRRKETVRGIAELATQNVNAELKKCDADLKDAWAKLTQYKHQHNIVDVNTQVSSDAQGLANLDSQLSQARVELVRAQLNKRTLERELGRTSAVVEASRVASANPVVQTIDANLEQLQQQRAALLQDYLPSAPEIRSLDEQIAKARARKTEAMRSKAEAVTVSRNPLMDNLQQSYINAIVSEREANSKMAITSAQIQQVRARIATLPESEEQIAMLTSRISELGSTHSYLTNQQQALNFSMHGGLPSIMPVTLPHKADTPVSPNIPASLALTVVIAVCLAVGVAVVRDQLDDRIHTSDMLENLSGRRVLAIVPRVQNGFHGLVSDEECPVALLESFRIFRGNLLLSLPEPLPRVIMVTSAGAGEGKSTTVSNLAATIAMSGKRVLVIDGDLRHPSVHLIYGLPNTRGLSSVLAGDEDVDACLQDSGVDRLEVLTAGPTPTHPPELLSGPQLATLIRTLRDRYDCILIDSTPIIYLSDGTLLAKVAEGVVMVVAAERTRQPEVQSALHILEQLGTPILGLVHNRAVDSPPLTWQTGSE